MGGITGTVQRNADLVSHQTMCFVPSADLHVVTSEAQTRSEWLLRVWLNM